MIAESYISFKFVEFHKGWSNIKGLKGGDF